MNEYIAEITLDLDCRKSPPIIAAGQYDKGRKCLIHITANDTSYSATGATAIIKGRRKDKSCFSESCSIDNSGNVVLTMSEALLAVSGFAYAKIVLSDNSKTYSTQIFIIDVDNGLEGTITELDSYSVLNDCLNRLAVLLDVEDVEETLLQYLTAESIISNGASADEDNIFSAEYVADRFLYKYTISGNNQPESSINKSAIGYLPLRQTIAINENGEWFIPLSYLTQSSSYTNIVWKRLITVDDLINRTIAGISLQNNISAAQLNTALSAMSLAPSVPVNSGNTAPDTSSSEFSALNTGQLFKCVFTGGKVTYWMKDGGQRATQLTVDITGKMDLTPFTSETADNSFKKGQIAVSNGEVILKTAEIGNSGHKSLLEKQTTLPEVFTREYHGEWIVDTSDSTFQNLPIGYFFTAEIREVVTVYEKIGSSDYISVSDQATIGYVDSALLTKADQTAVEDIKAYIGYTDGDILGLQADFENSVFTRLAGAVGKTAGSDFDAYPMFGNRRRCNVEANGNIRAYYGDSGYYEDGNGGQVMVYQPAFFYKVVPLKLEKNAAGLGYHIRKANYYVSATPKPGFKRHPLFYDEQGNEIDYVLLSAYEGSMFDVSETAYVNDSVDTVTYGAGDLLCSVAGKKPISGKLTGIGTKANLETMANNYGSGWHLDTIKSVSANQLLMMIELGTLNTQTAIGQGVVNQSGSSNASSLTGSTSALGSATGMASQTTAESAGTETVNTTNGKLSVSYRGVENPWGNIWKHVNGINIWGDGTMGGGQIYIADGFTFNESSSADPYRATGISIANSNGYISAFGYGDEEFDWLLVPSECGGNSSLPVGDYCYVTSGLNGYRIVHWGGLWNSGDYAGGCGWRCTGFLGNRDSYFGGRLLYIPQ